MTIDARSSPDHDALSNAQLPASPPDVAEARRRILQEVQGAMVRRRRARRAVRVVAPLGVTCLAALVIWIGLTRVPGLPKTPSDASTRVARAPVTPGSADPASHAIPPSPGDPPLAAPSSTSASMFLAIQVIEPPPPRSLPNATPPAAPTHPSIAVREVGDAELLTLLAQTGRDAGIVRIDGHASVVCNSCRIGEEWLTPIGPAESSTIR